MSVETPGGDTEAKLKELIESLEYSDRHPEDIPGFVNTCGAAASFLSECKDDSVHWFCDSRTAKVGERSILGFSFEGGRALYASKLTQMLDRCPNCARGYHFALEDVKKSASRVGIPAGNLVPMFELVCKFNEERLMDRLNKVIEHKQSKPDATYHTLPTEMRSAVYESLYVAEMGQGGDLWQLFVRVVELLDTNHDLFGVDQIAPAVFFALFGVNSDMHKRARKALDVVDADSVSTLSKLNCKALLSVSKNCCSTRESRERLLYWYNADCVFGKLSSEAILSEFRQDDDDFVSRLLHDVLASPNIPLHGLLKFLGTLVTKLGSKFTTILPFKSKVLVSTVLDNPNFYHRLPLSGPIDPIYDTDYALRQEYLLDWIPPLVQSQSDEASDLTQLGENVFSGLLQLTKSLPAQDANARNFILSYALESVAHCFKFKQPNNESKLPLLEPVARIQRAGLKELIYNNRMVIIDNLRSPRKRLADAALKCLQLSIEFDVISALPDSTSSRVEITDQSVVAEISRSFPPSLWGELNKNPRVFDAKVVSTVLHSMKYAGFIAQPPVKKVTNYLPKKELSQQALLCSIESLRNISDMDGRMLKGVITNREVLVCLFLNLFSANADQNRAAVDLICQSFDSDAVNRLTAITSLFMHDLKVSLSAFCDAIGLVKQLQLFAPCSQLTKVAQDVSTTLYDTRKGIVDTTKKDQFSQGKDNELFRYWNTNWEFLRFSVHKTYAWSNQFKAEFMLEFMKDQLDYCKTLLDTFRLVEADLPPPTSNHTNGELLSLPAINTIDPLCQLLRLKDEALVYSSFQNIMTIIDLMKSFKVQFPKRVTDQFVKLAKQEISNIMPREQTSGLLAATGVFSNDEIDEILSKVGFDRSPSATPPPSNGSTRPSSQDSRNSTPPTTTAAASRPSPAPGSYAAAAAAANKKPGQQRSINEFMRTASGPAPPPPPPKAPEPQRTTAMDAVRAELLSQKSASGVATSSNRSQPPKEIHPPRPAGFNSARAKRLQANEETVNRTANQKAAAATEVSSESDDSDDEDGLFTDKKAPTAKPGAIRNINKPTVTPIGMDRRPRMTTLSEKEREERNMRARLNIDTSPLYRRVLSWDYHSNSEYPDENRKYERVMPSFKSVEQYQKTFEPLLLLECWQGIQKAKEESAPQETPFKVVVGNRITCDDFIDIYASVETSVLSKVKLTDSDVIVLTYFDDPDSDAKRPSKERPYCLAKIRELKPNYSADYADLMLRTYNPKTMLAHLSSKTILHGLRVMR
jgi:senataxin